MVHKILFLDDDAHVLNALKRQLFDAPHDCYFCSSAEEAFLRAKTDQYSVIISDLKMPEISGIEFLTKISYLSPDSVRIVLTGHADVHNAVAAINEANVDLYLNKPWNKAELLRRLDEAIAKFEERKHRKTQLTDLQTELQENQTRLQELTAEATKDKLTGLYNRRFFDDSLTRLWKAATRREDALAIIIVDIDYFKKVNDTVGHLEGDRILRTVAEIIGLANFRPEDIVARYGGEEFAIILPGTQDPLPVAERIRVALRERNIQHPGLPLGTKITVSVGAAVTLPQSAEYQAPQELLHVADMALYQAKNSGRDQCVCFPPSRVHS